MAVDPSQCVVRRANVDDLGGLKLLWERSRLQVLDLEKHLTEFQLIVSLEGDLIGAIGFHVEGKQAALHNEAFTQPEQEDAFRPMLWERLRTLARNHGLARLWTREQAPFWHQVGFAHAEPELLKKLPPSFGDMQGRWLAIQLREEAAAALSLEQEFELFQQASKAHTDEVVARARRLRTFAYSVVFVIIAAVLGLGGYLVFKSLGGPGRPVRMEQR